MGRQITLLLLFAVLALALVVPALGDVEEYDSRSRNERVDDQTTPTQWHIGLFHADVEASIDALVSTVGTFVRSAFTVVKAIVGAIHTVIVAVAKVLVKAAVKVAVMVGQVLLQFLFG